MDTAELISQFADEVVDAGEESFDLFARTDSSLSLGHLAPPSSRSGRATLSLTIPSLPQDLTVTQSSTLLHASLPGGTTGAVVWRLQPLLAVWLLAPTNPLFGSLLNSRSTLLELGTGIGGVLALALALAHRVARVVATDQPSVLRGLRANLAANLPDGATGGEAPARPKARGKRGARPGAAAGPSPIDVLALDWETADAGSLAQRGHLLTGPDAVLACDCVYNEALVAPLVRTCAEACGIRARWGKGICGGEDVGLDGQAGEMEAEKKPTVCVIAQQLRAPDVFEAWLQAFMERFRVWRVRGGAVDPGMRVEDGFVVHIGILKEDVKQ